MKSLVNGYAIDAEIAHETDCPKCGNKMNYRPTHENGVYRAFAFCYPCDEEIEF